MQSTTPSDAVSKTRLWAGRAVSGLAVLFLMMDGVMKLLKPAVVVKATVQLGYAESSIVSIGAILLACVLVHLIPRTAVLGAILLTGYLGGAVASQLRIGEPLFSHVLFPVYIALLIWGGLWLRDEQLNSVVPLRGRNRPFDKDQIAEREAAVTQQRA